MKRKLQITLAAAAFMLLSYLGYQNFAPDAINQQHSSELIEENSGSEKKNESAESDDTCTFCLISVSKTLF